MKFVIAAGRMIAVSDFLLALYWTAVGFVIFVQHRELLTAHILAVTHYAGAVIVLLAIEAYNERLRKFKRASGRGTAQRPLGPSVDYLASWALLTLTATGSDMFILMDVIAQPADAHGTAWTCELVVAVWAAANSVLAILWSGWMAVTALRSHAFGDWFGMGHWR